MSQANLFPEPLPKPAPDIPGLTYLSGYISAEQEKELLAEINHQPWLTDLKRRVQHYGYKYDYKARGVANDAYLGELPDWLSPLARRLHEEKIFADMPDQVIVNEYLPGQGISAHIDCVPCFGATVASLSLGSACIMEFSNPKAAAKREVWLENRSLVVLSGAARYEWMHAIPARKSDTLDGVKIARERRVSLTFRKIITVPEK